MTNISNSTFYIGMTGNIKKRIEQHKKKYSKGLVYKYNLNKLVHYEKFETPEKTITREKQIKKWNREWNINLIKDLNPNLDDLFYFFE